MNQPRNIFIGAAWPYANDSLHLGHVSGLIGADILARYFRANGDNVLYVSGSDCHGTPIVVSAEREKVEPEEIANKYHKEFLENLMQGLYFSYDNYTTTTTEIHKNIVQEFFLKLLSQGDIYKKEQELPFCEKCNRFLPDRYVEGTCPKCGFTNARGDQCDECGVLLDPKELINPKCKTCKESPTFKITEHFFLKLSAYQEKIEELLSKSTDWRVNAKGFTKKLLNEGLRDRAITRDTTWGIPIPLPGYESKSIYVWFEAVLGYFTASQEKSEMINQPDYWRNFWQNDDSIHYYVHGKDNIPFHTIIWPTILMAYGDNLHLPDVIISSEYLTLEKKQFSKSRKWAVWLPDFLKEFDADTLRYYLVINGPETSDADFSWKEYQQRTNKELIGNFANFIHRTIHLISQNYPDGVSLPKDLNEEQSRIISLLEKSFAEVGNNIEKGNFREALKAVVSLAEEGNRFLALEQPWSEISKNDEKAKSCLAVCAQIIHSLGILISPFLPETGRKINRFFENDSDVHKFEFNRIDHFTLKKADPLFKKIEDLEVEREISKLK